MASVKNVSGDVWIDAETNTRVAKGGVLEIPDERAWGYVQMAVWDAADEATAVLAEEQRPKTPEELAAAEEPAARKSTKKAAAAAKED